MSQDIYYKCFKVIPFRDFFIYVLDLKWFGIYLNGTYVPYGFFLWPAWNSLIFILIARKYIGKVKRHFKGVEYVNFLKIFYNKRKGKRLYCKLVN